MHKYSQLKALMAITKASLISIFRSPQAVFFSLFFPIVLILIFGAIGGGGGLSVDVAIDHRADTANPIYQAITHDPVFDVKKGGQDTLEDMMKKGRITALINITKNGDTASGAAYNVHLISSSANLREMPALRSVMRDVIHTIDDASNRRIVTVGKITEEQVPGREYKMIDFYLPGMIGFSMIGAAVFGVAFLFFNLRESLVLKRLYASPVNRRNIIIGETLSRIIFQLLTVVVLVLFGRYFYGFTLANGWITFVEILLVTLVGLLVFMGAGFVISSVAKNQNVIPIYSNLFMFPQYFLSGTFFPKNILPSGVQWLVEALPLTALNDALRKISFEGAHLYNCGKQLGILGVWGIVVYFIAIKVFRWE
ncbi:MAG: ABC transporter permease [Ferruginibacter sp.]